MMRKGKLTRFLVNSILLAVIVAAGVTVYQAGTTKIPDEGPGYVEEFQEENSDFQEKTNEEMKTGSNQVEAEWNQNTIPMEETNNSEYVTELQQMDVNAVNNPSVEAELGNVFLSFSDDSLMQWPVEGSLLMDYNVDQTVYYKTLDQYKINPAIVVQAEEGNPVMAAAKGQVVSVEESEETGMTVTMNLGNGYEAIYGQLDQVEVVPGEMVEAAQIIGTVADPSRYYTEEGSNLYFAMTKDGEPVDPLLYLP